MGVKDVVLKRKKGVSGSRQTVGPNLNWSR